MSAARYHRPPDVAMVELLAADGSTAALYLAPLPDGPAAVLEGSAASIWSEAVAEAPDEVAARVARRAGVGVSEIRDSVSAFLEELVGRGLLERVSREPDRQPG